MGVDPTDLVGLLSEPIDEPGASPDDAAIVLSREQAHGVIQGMRDGGARNGSANVADSEALDAALSQPPGHFPVIVIGATVKVVTIKYKALVDRGAMA